MSMTLPDGTVLPSYFGSDPMGQRQGLSAFNNMSLRQGEVSKVIYPDDPKSISGTVVEYSVVVQVRDGNGPAASVTYPNCTVANLFGGVSDVLRYTLRARTSSPEKGETISDGSKVLVLCVNGELRRAIIVGGINDSQDLAAQDLSTEKKADGHNLRFEFNGAQVAINDAGEVQVRYRGKTKVDGSLDDSADSNAEGSTVIFDKTGGIKLYTKDQAQYVYLNNKDKKIEILADSDWNVKSNQTLTFNTGGDMSFTSSAKCLVTASNNVFIKSSGVLVGSATDAWMLGSTYRRNETVMLKQISAGMKALAGSLGGIAAGLQTAAATLPLPGGPAAAAVGLQAAAAAMVTTPPIFAQMAAAIEAFEALAPLYLSKKNKND